MALFCYEQPQSRMHRLGTWLLEGRFRTSNIPHKTASLSVETVTNDI